jgi:hypothetical protein
MLPADVVPAYVKNARKSMKKLETKAANKRFQYSEIGSPKKGSKSADEAAKAARLLKTCGKLAVV